MKIHIVKKGESLYEIAQKHHIELDKLIAANPQIADPNVIDVGMKVKIPHDSKPVTPPTDYLYKHTVVQGDSLWNLGKAWGIPLSAMIAANPQLKNPNVLMTGEIVYIPKIHAAPTPGLHHKKDTSQIVPEAPLPVEAGPISELPETPHMEMAPAEVAPLQPEKPAEKPVMPAPFEQKTEKETMPQAPAMEMPVMPQAHTMEMPAMPSFPSFPQMTEKESMTQAPHMEMPWMPSFPSFPQMTEMQTMPQAPHMEMPAMPSFPNFPQMELPHMKTPDAAVPYTPMEAVNPYGVTEGAHPAYIYPNWGKSEQQHEYPETHHPYHHLFQQYEVPSLEAAVHESHHSGGLKGKENVWAEPAHPSMPMMPQAAEMPFYDPNTAHPAVHGLYQPMLSGDCGCGKPQLQYTAQMPAFHPHMVQPNEPFLAMTHHFQMPYAAAAGYQPYQSMAAGGGYAGVPVHPGFGAPMGSPFGMPLPWTAYADHAGKDKSDGKQKSRGDEERAEISQSYEAGPAIKEPKRQKRQNSTYAAIRRLMERNRRKARESSRTRRAVPWLSQ